MNRPVPRGDRGNRNADPGWPSGPRGAVPGALRLVLRTAADPAGIGRTRRIAPVAPHVAHVGAGLADWRHWRRQRIERPKQRNGVTFQHAYRKRSFTVWSNFLGAAVLSREAVAPSSLAGFSSVPPIHPDITSILSPGRLRRADFRTSNPSGWGMLNSSTIRSTDSFPSNTFRALSPEFVPMTVYPPLVRILSNSFRIWGSSSTKRIQGTIQTLRFCSEPKKAQQSKKARPAGAGRAEMDFTILLADPVRALTALRLKGLDGKPRLLHRASHIPANGMLLPSHRGHDLGNGCPVLPFQHHYDLPGLAALARPVRFGGFGILARLGRLLRTSG